MLLHSRPRVFFSQLTRIVCFQRYRLIFDVSEIFDGNDEEDVQKRNFVQHEREEEDKHDCQRKEQLDEFQHCGPQRRYLGMSKIQGIENQSLRGNR